jgi:hypothetical protein
MFTDPLNLTPIGISAEVSAVGSTIQFALLPGDIAGRTVRTGTLGGLDATLTQTSSKTKESPPFGTVRDVTRLEVSETNEEGVTGIGFAQIIIGYPNAVIDEATIRDLVRHLCSLYLFGPDAGTSSTFASNGTQFLQRKKAGEQ